MHALPHAKAYRHPVKALDMQRTRRRTRLKTGTIAQAGIALVTISLALRPAAAQKSSASCSSGWEWSFNKDRKSPCDVAAQLLSLCQPNPKSFTLQSSSAYIPTSNAGTAVAANTCSCNVVTYNLLMACQACQGGDGGSDIPTWVAYGSSCSTCSSENGISPGPCTTENSVGFPASVRPQSGNIEIPAWAFANTSPNAWSANGARKIGLGQERTISAPAAISPTSTASNPSPSNSGTNNNNNSKDELSKNPSKQEGGSLLDKFMPMSSGMKAAVIACCCAAAVILTGFIIYLIRLCHKRKKEKKLKQYGDSAFDKVLPAKAAKDESGASAADVPTNSPKKLNFKSMMTRFTLTPRTPGPYGLSPLTPRTPRFFGFAKPSTTDPKQDRKDPRLTHDAGAGTHVETLANQTPHQQRSTDQNLAPVALRRAASNASAYSSTDDHKSTAGSLISRDGSIKSTETVTTGSVRAAKPKVRKVDSMGSLAPAKSGAASIVGPSNGDTMPFYKGHQSGRGEVNDAAHEKRPERPARGPRIKSQSAKVSVWSDTAVATSEPQDRTSNGTGSSQPSRRPSIASSAPGTSTRSNSRIEDDGAYENDQHETLQLPEELRRKQREASERFSSAESVGAQSSSGTGEVDGPDNASRSQEVLQRTRDSHASIASTRSNLRRLDSVVGQLGFDDGASNYGSPTVSKKKTWLTRASTRSGRSVVPPSPAPSSNVGFAL